MNILAPTHINKYCIKDYKNLHFEQLSQEYKDEVASMYQIQCDCGCFEFLVFKDDHPTVYVHCKKCGNKITVYELSYYPAACKLLDKFVQEKVQDNEYEIFEVGVLYEYGSYYDNNNDISWCIIWLYNPKNNNVIELINDETS